MGDRTSMTGEWLAHCAACPIPEIANVLKRAGVRHISDKIEKLGALLGLDTVRVC